MEDPVEIQRQVEPVSLFHFDKDRGGAYKLMEGIGTSFQGERLHTFVNDMKESSELKAGH